MTEDTYKDDDEAQEDWDLSRESEVVKSCNDDESCEACQ